MDRSMDTNFSIVALDKFIQATRDSGYRDTTSAVAELVDNSLQAGATEISLILEANSNEKYPITLAVVDNGHGMDAGTLRTSLRFGGTTRFNDRGGLGRYGMGLPNSSLSQAQRVTVHTWRSADGDVLSSHLDLDEIASKGITDVPEPCSVARPRFINGSNSGTAVVWTKCDRLDNRRLSTIAKKLGFALGRRFRHYLWRGVSISVNGAPVLPFDPLYLHPSSIFSGAKQFAEEVVYEVEASPDDHTGVGFVKVRFSELPVVDWSNLSNHEKRTRGIAKGAGVSIVRAGREVDYGWFFLGDKRRENYDDWWRCEIQFEPILDEAFGITHTKQQIRPRPHLLEALVPDMESTARVLNARARKAHLDVKISARFLPSEDIAKKKDKLLEPLPEVPRKRDKRVLDAIGARLGPVVASRDGGENEREYRVIPAALSETAFFNYARDSGRLILVINPEHPFYKTVYQPLLDSNDEKDQEIRTKIDLVLMAAARSESLLEEELSMSMAEKYRKGWSDTLATFLND